MRISRFFNKTLKEVPKEAQVASHKLMFRAGLIQKLASGIYNYLPMGLKSLRKIEAIIREELEKKECQEVLMPMVQPAELWEESGRWNYYGAELLRFQDRKGAHFCLGPTHEEVITDMVRRNLKSYKQLPWNLYQIQSKFRDEIRPRFGLMRGREFIMKDAYSFDADEAAAKESYRKMYDAYSAIFRRCGLNFKAVQAATGTIGGDESHEFQVLAKSGEDILLSCNSCDYAANLDKAVKVWPDSRMESGPQGIFQEVETRNMGAVEEVAAFLDRSPQDFIKSMLYLVDEEPVLVMIRGDLEINEVKIQTALHANSVVLADDHTIQRVTGAAVGFAGPIGLKQDIKVLADHSLFLSTDMVTGANKSDYHLVKVNPHRDFETDLVGDFSFARAGDPCPHCQSGVLEEHRGIEVGHVFYLGDKYSKSMDCSFLDREGKQQTAVMGCYGIGVGRTMAAAIEQNHDEDGIIWPAAIAPFEVLVLPVQTTDGDVASVSEKIYQELKEAGIDAALDDRDERPGFKFKDADLIGYPYQIIVGKRNLEDKAVEFKTRGSGEKKIVPVGQIVSLVRQVLEK